VLDLDVFVGLGEGADKLRGGLDCDLATDLDITRRVGG